VAVKKTGKISLSPQIL